ncbi:hypothetical protein CO614_08615 [Lysobacteraceae bacterium NML120232]|nr:hypothetical protein CO608_05295 [Xanthomonadaceae bacterium NML08-0793]PJK10891.1 hypothetical protein CO614_08615 [Xanthomonadaceae bacterium NML120232]
MWRRSFWVAWSLVLLVKLLIAVRLPLFVDEAFYWQESRHPAWAYSDLPGLTAWLIGLGERLAGHHLLAVRLPFLLLGAALPWLVARIATRWFGAAPGWQAGLLTCLMPLSATLGLLALPDVPMAFAAALCLAAGARLLQRVDAAGAAMLALGLVIGALSHYRFAGVIVTGFLALMWMPEGRKLLRNRQVIAALLVGALAWLPLIFWNLANADAGLKFHLVDRHPWRFDAGGIAFVLIQMLLVTPLLFVALMQAFGQAMRAGKNAQWRYFGLLGGISTIGLFVLGFFADNERVSFHWTLPGYLALLAAVPLVLARWSRSWRQLTWGVLAAGTAAMLGWYLLVASPAMRSEMAGQKHYPSNFSGWNEVASAAREVLAKMPENTELVVDNFKLGAELGFAMNRADIRVLEHPLNAKHGRAAQLQLWGLTQATPVPGSQRPALLVIDSSDVRYRALLDHYRDLCRQVGAIVPTRIVNVDHGARRFILAALPARDVMVCATPAMAYVDAPQAGAKLVGRFVVEGWAFREGIGLEAVEVLIDGKPVARAEYGLAREGLADFWGLRSEPNKLALGFRAEVDASGLPSGRHWLGLRLHGRDGLVEDWAEQPLEIGK